MTTPELTDEQLLLAWQELTKEQQRRFDRLFDTDQAVRIRCILDELGGETEAEAQAKALAELPKRDKGKAVGGFAGTIIRPLVDAMSPPRYVHQSPPQLSSRFRIQLPSRPPRSPPRRRPCLSREKASFEFKPASLTTPARRAIARSDAGQFNARGELVLRDEGGSCCANIGSRAIRTRLTWR